LFWALQRFWPCHSLCWDVVVATEVVATEAEVIPEGFTEGGCQQQIVAVAGQSLRAGPAWPAISREAGCQQQIVPAARQLSLHFAAPRQIATEVRQIQLQTPTETQLRKEQNRRGTVHRKVVRPRTIEGTIGTGGGTRMIGA
jgi:hypothetical protein